MILMSESLTDRVILEHVESEIDDQIQDIDDHNPHLSDQSASVQFEIDDEIVRCAVKKMSLSSDAICITFVSVPSLPLRLRASVPVRCILACGSHILDFDLRSFETTWDNMEGKQLCTIISKIEQHARSSE